jgi:hypothetical protein
METSTGAIKRELGKYGLTVTGINKYSLGHHDIYHVAAKGHLYDSELLGRLWPSNAGGYPGMADAMHNDLYFLPPETTEIVVVDSGDNIKGVSYFVFVFGGGG